MKKIKQRFNRKYETRDELKVIYIFTEGKQTEPNYFESKKKEIRNPNIKIKIKGIGYNAISLVDYANAFVSENNIEINKSDSGYDCWVVFDKDDFDKDFDNAINKAQSNRLNVAYSNEAFELWFLLHFNFMNSAIGRKDYNNKLTENLKRLTGDKKYKYEKTTDVYSLIRDKELDAIRNAKKLLKQYDGETSFLKKNPSTTVHLLVEDLNKLKK